MKNLVIIASCTVLFAACGPNTSQTSEQRVSAADSVQTDSLDVDQIKQVSFRVLSEYYVKNTQKQSDTVACWVFNNAIQRDSILGAAKAMKQNKIDSIDFGKEMMIAVTLTPSELSQQLLLSSATQTSDEVNLYFAIKTDTTPKKKSTSAAVWVGALPKDQNIKRVKFYNGDNLLETVKVDEQ